MPDGHDRPMGGTQKMWQKGATGRGKDQQQQGEGAKRKWGRISGVAAPPPLRPMNNSKQMPIHPFIHPNSKMPFVPNLCAKHSFIYVAFLSPSLSTIGQFSSFSHLPFSIFPLLSLYPKFILCQRQPTFSLSSFPFHVFF
jgi:hypothetical protein